MCSRGSDRALQFQSASGFCIIIILIHMQYIIAVWTLDIKHESLLHVCDYASDSKGTLQF